MFTHLLYPCSEDGDAVLVTLVTLFIYFFCFTIHVHSFHMGRIVVLEVHYFIFVVMFEYYLISGFNIAGFANFGYLCSV